MKGDGVLDEEEFEYTLSDAFNISPKECQTAFRMMTKVGLHVVLTIINYFFAISAQVTRRQTNHFKTILWTLTPYLFCFCLPVIIHVASCLTLVSQRALEF